MARLKEEGQKGRFFRHRTTSVSDDKGKTEGKTLGTGDQTVRRSATTRNRRPRQARTAEHSGSAPERSTSQLVDNLVDVDDIRRRREAYFNKIPERGPLREPEPNVTGGDSQERTHMPYVTEVTSRVSGHSGKDRSTRRSSESSKRRSQKDTRREGSDDEGYVYTTARRETSDVGKKDSRHASRSELRRSTSTRHKHDAPALRRSKTDSSRSRYIIVEEVDEATPRPEPRRSTTDAAPRVTRSSTLRNNTHTRPSLHRSGTTSTARPSLGRPSSYPVGPAASNSGKSNSPSKHNRPNSGFFTSLFGSAPPAPQVRKVECLTCMEEVPSSKTGKLSCGHRMCHDCLKRIFTMSVTDPQHMPPRCCTTEHIPLKHVEHLFNLRFKVLWNKKYQEYTTKNRIYCPTRGCGEWIKPSNIRMDTTVGRKYGKCGKCNTKVCVLCNGKWHTRRECPKDEETNRFVEIAKEAGWQRCYSCKAMVELKEGCNHMTCRCTAEFCMICGNKWKTCDCPWFNYATQDPADRLQMNIPVPIHLNIPHPLAAQVHRDRPPAAAVPRPAPPHAHPNAPQPAMATRNNNPALTYQTELDRRRRQERADEELARRLQFLDLEEEDEHLMRAETAGLGGLGAVFGVGNAAGHFLNEDFVRNAVDLAGGFWGQRGRGRGNAARRGGGAGGGEAGERQAMREEVEERVRGFAAASAMAGLARDGSRTGAARVGGWLRHVDENPVDVRSEEMAGAS